MKKIVFFLISLILVSCASTPGTGEQVRTLIDTGQCDAAEQMALENYIGANRYYSVALVELDCRMNRQAGIELLTICSSMRHESATNKLRELGEPVPRPAAPFPPVRISPALLGPI